MPAPVLSVAQMRKWEKDSWAAGRNQVEVISRVGHLVAARVRQMTRPGDLIVVLAGKGHNGDDARYTSQNLNDREVYLINVLSPEVSLRDLRSQLSLQPTLLIDGLFGIGLNRPLEAPWIKLVKAINEAGIPILALDVPSGLNADSGEALGAAVRATVTLTLGAPKRGLVLAKAWPFVGRLEVEPDIGLVPTWPSSDLQWTLRDDFLRFPPPRPVEGHKGTFGHAVLFAGSMGYHGAAVLAARAALQATPGLVTLFTSPDVYIPVASQLQAAMVHPWRTPTALPETCSAILFGPGLASPKLPEECRAELVRLWNESPLPIVADATALDWLPQRTAPFKGVRVLTPHPGEAARLLDQPVSAIQADRPKALLRLSRQYGGAWIVLKGYQTLLGRSSGKRFVNSSGNPYLAQGGSGDVLAGYLVGLLAQASGLADPFETLRFAVWQHGATADLLSSKRKTWTVDDLVKGLGSVPLS